MYVTKDGRGWRIGTASDVAWIAGQTTHGPSNDALPQDSRATNPRLVSFNAAHKQGGG
jgi:hypothetical protein